VIAVFGATGRVGRATVQQLVARGIQVRAVVHRSAGNTELHEISEVVVADLHDPRAIANAVAGSDAVQVLCPIMPTLADPIGEAAIVMAALAQGLRIAAPPAVLAISDYGAEIPSGTGITMILHRLETILNEMLCQLTILRSAEHMHNWVRQIPLTLQTGVLASMHHPITKAFPTVDAHDVGAVAAELLLDLPTDRSSPRIIYVEGPRRYTALDVANAITQISGRQVTALELPREDWESVLAAGGASAASAKLVAQTFDAHNDGHIEAVTGIEIIQGGTDLADSLALENHRIQQGLRA
jgi:uncharacterized protein YbjT (DUF2867 family)